MLSASCGNRDKDPGETSVPETQTNAASGPLTKVRFLPYWVNTAQFSGYFVGKEKGIYQKYGIDLDIITFQPSMIPAGILESGAADFAALWLVNAIEMKASGTDIVSLAQPSQQSSLMLLAKKSSGIRKLQDINGRKAGIWTGYEMQPRALFKKYQLDVEIIPIGSTNNLFLSGAVDVTNANWFDEYHTILNSGFNEDELVTFFFKDYGLNFLEDGIYCLSKTLVEHPELCVNFVRATLEGWDYAFSHPEEALDIVVRYAKEAKTPVNRIHQRWMLDRYYDLYKAPHGQSYETTLKRDVYENIAGILFESKLITHIPAYGDFYKPYQEIERSLNLKPTE